MNQNRSKTKTVVRVIAFLLVAALLKEMTVTVMVDL